MNSQYMGLYTVLNALQVLNDTTVGARLAGEAQRQPSGCYRVSVVGVIFNIRPQGGLLQSFVCRHQQTKDNKNSSFHCSVGPFGK